MMYTEINGWDGQNKTNDETYSVGIMPSGEDFFKYYGLHLSEGEWLSDKSITNDVIINETAALKFEWKSAVGKKFYSEYDGQKTFYHVIGVVKDFSHLPLRLLRNLSPLSVPKSSNICGDVPVSYSSLKKEAGKLVWTQFKKCRTKISRLLS